MNLHIYVSKNSDGSMKSLNPDDQIDVDQTRAIFLKAHDIQPEDTTLVNLTYDRVNFCEYTSLTEGSKGDGITRTSTIISDGLVTTDPNHALMLPLADCIGAVLHDPVRHILMVSHLGRHNIEQYGGTHSVEYLAKKHGANPRDLRVWLSPAAGRDSYPLFAFDNRSLHDVATEQLIVAGVPRANIDVSPSDTTTDLDYFSHSEFLKGNRETDGRFAIVAVLR